MARCPICKKNEADTATRPFCSRRCADVDLQRWLTGAYVIPGAPDELDSEDNAPE
ncbi:MAG: DNA gyrase inhibitor YacG [Brevundimonas sp.]|nr:MAG: DNA gyrase inhibitor YacG [Brevundimonas sp.]